MFESWIISILCGLTAVLAYCLTVFAATALGVNQFTGLILGIIAGVLVLTLGDWIMHGS